MDGSVSAMPTDEAGDVRQRRRAAAGGPGVTRGRALQDDPLTAQGRQTRVELLAAPNVNEGRLNVLQGRVPALEVAGQCSRKRGCRRLSSAEA